MNIQKQFQNCFRKGLFILSFLLLLFYQNSFAQQETIVKYLTIEEAVSMALHENNLIKSSEYFIKKANWDVKRAWAELFPVLRFNTRYSWIDEQTFAERDFRRYLPPEFANQIPQTVFQESYFSSFDLSMPIFNGVLLNGLSIAYEQETMTEKMAKSTREQTIFSVITNYLSVLRNKEIYNLQNEYLKLSRLNYEKADRLYQANRYSQNEALRWQIDYQQQKSTVVNSESEVRSSLLSLGRVINSNLDVNTVLNKNIPEFLLNEVEKIKSLSTQEILDIINFSEDELISVNASLAAAKSNAEISRLIHKNSYSAFLPKVNLSYSYGWRENSSIKLDDYSPKTLMVNFSIPIFSGFQNYTSLKSSLYDYKKNEEEFTDQLLNTKLILTNVVNNILNLKEQLELSKSNIEYSENNYSVVERQREKGLVSNIDYIDAKLNMQNAKLSSITNSYAFITAIIELYYLVGKIETLIQ